MGQGMGERVDVTSHCRQGGVELYQIGSARQWVRCMLPASTHVYVGQYIRDIVTLCHLIRIQRMGTMNTACIHEYTGRAGHVSKRTLDGRVAGEQGGR